MLAIYNSSLTVLSYSYVLTLITDGMRSVRAFHFDKAAASVLTTCVSSVCHNGQGQMRQEVSISKAQLTPKSIIQLFYSYR